MDIERETIKGILNATKEQKLRMDSKIFRLNGISFQLHLFPNKSWLNNDGYVGFCWRIQKIPKWINKIHIVYKLYCMNSLSVAKDRIILKNDNDINKIGHGWDLNVMKLPHNYPLSITFACYIECKFNANAKDDYHTNKNNGFVKLCDDGYRKLIDKMNYKIY